MHKMILFKHYSFTAIWLNSIWNVINTQYHALNILSININRQNMHKMLQYRRRCIMYINTGYLNHSHKDFKDKSRPLIVGSCGTYRLSQHPKMPTYRPRGRLDYQIIYISSGLVHFHFDNPENETIIPAGHIVLFRPKELQKYEFYGKDRT